MKGIILAGGSGTRLYPSTRPICKQLVPIYDKPMIYYPLSTLMLAGIRDVLIISTPQDLPRFEELFGDGSDLGMSLSYAAQQAPNGLAEAFIIGESFIGDSSVCMILGDNLFYGHGLSGILNQARTSVETSGGAKVFGYYVNEPQHYGVAEFDDDGRVISIEEKPAVAKSNYAVTGLYFYDNNVTEISKNITPSARGELEITSVNNAYLEKDALQIELLGRGFAWLDTGTHDSLLEASQFIHVLEKRIGMKVACVEEIAYYNKWINREQLLASAEPMKKNGYGQYLLSLANRKMVKWD